jgi:shikimate kinase
VAELKIIFEKVMSGNIVLIGFMAVGKGSIARALSRLTGRFCVDTDDLIESMAKTKIKKIFATRGEPYFRELERQTGAWLADNVRNTVISTGGGFFSVENVTDIGTIVYLHNEFELILERVYQHPGAARKIKKRPLLRDREQARILYEQRLPRYREVADQEINVGDKSVGQAAAEIVDILRL